MSIKYAPFRMLNRVEPEDVPRSEDLVCSAELQEHLLDEARFSVLAGGDVMLGGRAKRVLKEHGPKYPFAAVLPLLRHADAVVANLEGPLASTAPREDRTFSYRVHPASAESLRRAGIGVVTLANNHLQDCGRAGVLETMKALEGAGIAWIGAGETESKAHRAAILWASGLRVGFLGYYWNRRCAATDTAPGSAMDEPSWLERDIRGLRRLVDRVIVTFHWGVPYEREPMPGDRDKARLAIDLGADAVIGHHPHVIQPLEIHRERPILYSVGNFTFGSGNSLGEGLLVGLRFERRSTLVTTYPIYVKNRDPRVNYQPKALRGAAAHRCLSALVRASGVHGDRLVLEEMRARLVLPYPDRSGGHP